MKYLFRILVLTLLSLNLAAQSKPTRLILAKTKLLHEAIFQIKDSAVLESVFAKGLTYEHSSGKIQSREEAIKGIISNESEYTEAAPPTPYGFSISGDSALVTKVFKATEKKVDGTASPLNLTITYVWIKENGDWKLIRRRAVKNQ